MEMPCEVFGGMPDLPADSALVKGKREDADERRRKLRQRCVDHASDNSYKRFLASLGKDSGDATKNHE